VYVVAVAPEMSEQFAPARSHRSHCCVNVGVGEPVHVPFAAVRTEPTRAVPVIVGRAVFAGAVATVRTDAFAVWPSGFVIVIVCEPPVAPTVLRSSVTWVGSVYVTEFTVTPPLTDTAMRHVPEPGSQNPEPDVEVPVSTTDTEVAPALIEVGEVEAGVAGGGARILPTLTPQLSVPSVYSWIVQNVWPSHGSTLVWEKSPQRYVESPVSTL
jgi:hypothetical protein